MKPFKDRLEEIITNPQEHAQNAGSLEDQFVLILNMIDSDLVIIFNNWKLGKGVVSNQKLTYLTDDLIEMGLILNDFFKVHMNDN